MVNFIPIAGHVAPRVRAAAILREDASIVVVFTDIALGGDLDGWDIGRTARAVRHDMAVIYASGHPDDPSKRVTGSMFFAKPYDPDAVASACRTLCRGARDHGMGGAAESQH